MAEFFDAVLAEALRHFIGSGSAEFQQRNRAYFDRLQSAHEAEVAELHESLTAAYMAGSERMRDRAEAAEREARRWCHFVSVATEVSEDLNLAIFLGDKETADRLVDAAIAATEAANEA